MKCVISLILQHNRVEKDSKIVWKGNFLMVWATQSFQSLMECMMRLMGQYSTEVKL